MNHFIFYLLKDIKATLQRLKSHWLHTMLSVIGIMVGVISIVILLSVSEGVSKEALKNIKDFGLNTIRIRAIDNKQNLTTEDYTTIVAVIRNSGIVSPRVNYKKAYINFLSKDFNANLYLSNSSFLKVENLKIQRGRKILPYDIKEYHRVAIISSDLSKKYHIDIDDFLKVKNSLLRVIGIASINSKMNNFIQIPISINPFDKKNLNFDEISVFIRNRDNIFSFASLLENRLIEKHQNSKNFELIIPLKIMEKSRETHKLFSMITIIIATLSLLTGGVSVMNVMLSNISEQTREIGLRSALGATPKRIVQYYLIYAILMTFLGGLLGIIIGYIALWFISVNSSIAIIFSIKALIIALFISIFSGTIFGLYPALRASKIEPMLALKEF